MVNLGPTRFLLSAFRVSGVYLHSRVVTNVFENAAAPFMFYYFVGWCKSLLSIERFCNFF